MKFFFLLDVGHRKSLILRLDILSLELVEGLDWNVGDQCVELVDRVFVVIAATCESDADTEWWISKMRVNAELVSGLIACN